MWISVRTYLGKALGSESSCKRKKQCQPGLIHLDMGRPCQNPMYVFTRAQEVLHFQSDGPNPMTNGPLADPPGVWLPRRRLCSMQMILRK
jgi:hypothetical protein